MRKATYKEIAMWLHEAQELARANTFVLGFIIFEIIKRENENDNDVQKSYSEQNNENDTDNNFLSFFNSKSYESVFKAFDYINIFSVMKYYLII